MAVGFGNKQSAVLVSDPVRNRFEINPFLDGIAYEVMPEAMVSEPGKPRNAARSIQGLPG